MQTETDPNHGLEVNSFTGEIVNEDVVRKMIRDQKTDAVLAMNDERYADGMAEMIRQVTNQMLMMAASHRRNQGPGSTQRVDVRMGTDSDLVVELRLEKPVKR